MSRRTVLLLDIDGVLLYEVPASAHGEQEVIRLHGRLAGCLWPFRKRVFVLTHRSRREAHELLQCAGIDRGLVEYCFTADDMLSAALRSWQIPALLRAGLRKSLILPRLRERYGIEPQDVCFVDDRAENLQEMLNAGVGYGLHAPSELRPDGALVTFDFADVVARFQDWNARRGRDGEPARSMDALPPREHAIEDWRRTGRHTRKSARGVFGLGRKLGRSLRRALNP